MLHIPLCMIKGSLGATLELASASYDIGDCMKDKENQTFLMKEAKRMADKE